MRESEWDQDHGEPHNEPSPFPTSNSKQQHGESQSKEAARMTFEEAQRERARMSYQQSQRLAQRARHRREEQTKAAKDDDVSKELRKLQEKLRELRRQQ